eukprot:jgi/Picre1/30650/NNA_006011.t1
MILRSRRRSRLRLGQLRILFESACGVWIIGGCCCRIWIPPGIDVIDLSSQTVVKRLLHGDGDGSSAVLDMVHTPCGRFMVTAEAHAVTIRHADSLEVVQRFSIDDYEVESADYCPERNVFVAGGSDMWTHMYDAGSGALLDHGRGHHGPVHCVRFSPKAMRLCLDLKMGQFEYGIWGHYENIYTIHHVIIQNRDLASSVVMS